MRTTRQTLTSNDSKSDGRFGWCMDSDGEYAVIGAPNETTTSSSSARTGRVHVYRKVSGSWTRIASLTSPNGKINGGFGSSVGVHHGRLVIGAYKEDNGQTQAGRAYVYGINGNSVILQATLGQPTPESYAHFGYSVSIEDDLIAIGATGADVPGINGAGAAFTYNYESGTGWTRATQIISPIPDNVSEFGYAVSVNGGRVAISAPREFSVSGGNFGRVYVFHRRNITDTTWRMSFPVISPDPSIMSSFGKALCLHGEYLLIGDNEAHNHGRAHLYVQDGTRWIPIQSFKSTTGKQGGKFGSSVYLDSDKLLIGALNEGIGDLDGAVHTYSHDGEVWNHQEQLTIKDGSDGRSMGASVTFAQNDILVGASHHHDGSISSGVVYVYDDYYPYNLEILGVDPTRAYIGVDGSPREVEKIYVKDNGAYQQVWEHS